MRSGRSLRSRSWASRLPLSLREPPLRAPLGCTVSPSSVTRSDAPVRLSSSRLAVGRSRTTTMLPNRSSNTGRSFSSNRTRVLATPKTPGSCRRASGGSRPDRIERQKSGPATPFPLQKGNGGFCILPSFGHDVLQSRAEGRFDGLFQMLRHAMRLATVPRSPGRPASRLRTSRTPGW